MAHQACLAGITVGDGREVAVMGALNVSPESFYSGSIVTRGDRLLRAAEAMARAGAVAVDIGALSTAPYLITHVSEREEADRLGWAVGLVTSKLDVPVSADTSRGMPARAALAAGARIINDVTGLTGDPDVGRAVASAGAGLIVMASERDPAAAAVRAGGRRGAGAPPSEASVSGVRAGGRRGAGAPPSEASVSIEDPIDVVLRRLEESLGLAREAGVPFETLVVDPGIGFFRQRAVAWHEWDCSVLAGLDRLRVLARPICVGVSRKSFIGALTGEGDPARRLPGSLAATAAAVLAGAHVIRAHDVAETVQAVKVAEAVRRSARRAST